MANQDGATTHRLPAATDEPDALVDVAASHLVDRATERLVITETTMPVVYLSPARRRLLASSAAERRACVLVTGESSVLTPAYAELAQLTRARWVVDGPHGVRDATIGRRLRTPDDVIGSEAGFERAPEHARLPDGVIAMQFAVSCTIRHRNRDRAAFGGAIEALRQRLAPNAALEWGIAEPLNVAWAVDEVGAYLREQLPHGPWAFVAGEQPDGAAISASTRCRQTKQGAEEIVTFTTAVGEATSGEAHEALRGGAAALGALAGIGTPLFAMAMARLGRADLCTSPTLAGPAAPLAMLIGAPAMRAFGDDAAGLATSLGGELRGPRRRPSLVVEVGTSLDPRNLTHVRDVLTAIGRERLEATLGPGLVRAMLGEQQPGDDIAAGVPGADVEPDGERGDDDVA